MLRHNPMAVIIGGVLYPALASTVGEKCVRAESMDKPF